MKKEDLYKEINENTDWEEIERIERLCKESGIPEFEEPDEKVMHDIEKLVKKQKRERHE